MAKADTKLVVYKIFFVYGIYTLHFSGFKLLIIKLTQTIYYQKKKKIPYFS